MAFDEVFREDRLFPEHPCPTCVRFAGHYLELNIVLLG